MFRYQDKAKIVFAPAGMLSEIIEPLTFYYFFHSKEAFFAFGQQAILDCHFRSNPPLIRLRWEKDG